VRDASTRAVIELVSGNTIPMALREQMHWFFGDTFQSHLSVRFAAQGSKDAKIPSLHGELRADDRGWILKPASVNSR